MCVFEGRMCFERASASSGEASACTGVKSFGVVSGKQAGKLGPSLSRRVLAIGSVNKINKPACV